jgi:outer membrane protein assembly factor BamE (lipoprotein component of BamABCDE complex)
VRQHFSQVSSGMSEDDVLGLLGKPALADTHSSNGRFLGCTWEYPVSREEKYEVIFRNPDWLVTDVAITKNVK